MAAIEKRLTQLESEARDNTIKFVLLRERESEAAALKREGLKPGRQVVIFLTKADADI